MSAPPSLAAPPAVSTMFVRRPPARPKDHAQREHVRAYRRKLIAIYRRHEPRKAKDADSILKKWEGREEELLAKVRAKYGVR